MSEGCGRKPSARAAGVGKETGYRWLRESFLALRDEGLSSTEPQARLGVVSARVVVWDREHDERPVDGRHHLQVPVDVEKGFWSRYLAGRMSSPGTVPSPHTQWTTSKHSSITAAGPLSHDTSFHS